MWNINENTIRVTEYDVLGELPDPFLFDDGGRVRTKEDWEKRRAEIYKTAVELQYGEIPPEPEVLKVETAYAGGKGGANSYRITAGTRGKTLTFMMKLFLPKTGDKFPVIVSGDMCFNYCFNEEYTALRLQMISGPILPIPDRYLMYILILISALWRLGRGAIRAAWTLCLQPDL